MRDVLIDVRCLQECRSAGTETGRVALALLRAARPALPGDRLVGLADPSRPDLPASVRALLDATRPHGYTGALPRPACLVQLAPLSEDPLFVARLLLHRAVPAASVAPGPLPAEDGEAERLRRAVTRHWLRRYDVVLPAADPAAFWDAVAALAPVRAPAAVAGRARLAVLTATPAHPLVEALRGLVELDQFAPGRRPPSALPLLSPRYDRVLSLIGNGAEHQPVAALAGRYGGAVMLQDAALLEPYGAVAAALAEAELGRRPDAEELAHWRAGTVRPTALLLGALARTAEPLIVHSVSLAAEIGRRYGRQAVVLPIAVAPGAEVRSPGGSPVLAARVAGLVAAESCVWAVEILASWGVQVRLELAGAAGPEAAALAAALGIADRVALAPAWPPAQADLGLCLAMRGSNSLAATLAAAAATGLRCIASESLTAAWDAPDWVRPIPDPPSPPLLAEAILLELARPPPGAAALEEFRLRHDPGRCARLLCAALGIAA